MTSAADKQAVELGEGAGGECFFCRRIVRPVPAGGDPSGDACVRLVPLASGQTMSIRKAKHSWFRDHGRLAAGYGVVAELEFARQAAIADALTAVR